MAAVQKFHINECVPVFFGHFDRSNENISNDAIDPDRTDENYDLAPDRGMSTYEYYKGELDRLIEGGAYTRKNTVTVCSWTVTLPQELLDKPKHIQMRFFKTSYEFLCERYCAPDRHNVLSANVHNDETTPHMHFQFMPTRFGNTKNGYIECFQGRDMVCRKDLQMFHSDFQKYLTDHGVMANVNSGITKAQGGNKTIDELKAESRERSQTREKTRKPLDIDFDFTL